LEWISHDGFWPILLEKSKVDRSRKFASHEQAWPIGLHLFVRIEKFLIAARLHLESNGVEGCHRLSPSR
jgi:hypothetical protein